MSVDTTISAKPLGALLPELADRPASSLMVRGLSLDSRSVRAGETFVALQGDHSHGFDHVALARENGAALVLCDGYRPGSENATDVVVIENLRDRLAGLASRFFEHPSTALSLTGVTGTNGKTTCSQLVAHALTISGRSAGVIGTLGWGLSGALQASTHTTADVITNQSMLASLRSAGAQAVAMEVSSHALAQGRVDGLQFRNAIFTNLTHDHLDYHGTLEAYGNAKARLLGWPQLRNAILNADDPFCAGLADRCGADVQVRWYSAKGRRADVRAVDVKYALSGISARVETVWGDGQLELPLIGQFNLQNALAVLATLCVEGLCFDEAVAALARVSPIPGRMEPVDGDGGPLVLIDYAHTPDALDQALSALREHVVGRIWCVFGCGGDRDRGKRSLMGRLAHERADVLVVTSDNPRNEDPLAIIRDICTGIPTGDEQRIVDRSEAIDYAVRSARAGDAVLIAGKGHEEYQEIAGRRLPYSDHAAVRAALSRRSGAA